MMAVSLYQSVFQKASGAMRMRQRTMANTPMTADPAAPSVAEIIDAKPLGAFQLGIAVLCFMALMVDGFDNQASAFAAPALTGLWHIARASLGPVFAASAFGTLVGSLLIGPVGDLFGRKTLVVLSLLMVAALMLLTTWVHNIGELIAVRFVTGLPLGALVPATLVIANEWSPVRNRAAMVTIMASGFALGAVLGGLLSSFILARWGWTSIFQCGAAATLLIAGAIALWMPESLRYLALRPQSAARRDAILRTFDPSAVRIADAGETSGTNLVLGLFTKRRAILTLLLWLAFFFNLLVLNFMTFWLPTLLAGAGLSPAAAIRTSTLFQVGGIVGTVTMGSVADRLGAWHVVLGGMVVSAAAMLLVGGLATNLRAAAIVAAGFGILGVQQSLGALSATLYPTQIRASGASWAQGIGRVGSTIGPLLGGFLIGRHWPTAMLFGAMAVFPVLGFASAWLLMRRLPKHAA
jgi:AAHS family 4-hydroxybenzoate transporter-like MFS transporter